MRYFFYNQPMPQFKTKKLKTVTPTDNEGIIPENTIIKKRLRYIIGGFLVVLTGVFLINMGIQAMSNIRLWSSTGAIFKPITFPIFSTKPTDESVTNILIAGIWGKWHEWGNLTDSLMLASFDAKNKQVTLLSLPRDLFVAYPNHTWAGRINTLYGIGKENGEGINLLANKVSEITGQPIQHYLVIDFGWFKDLVDALGWVEVDVPHDLVDREYPDENWGYTTFVVRAWTQTFDGNTALKYARSRHSTSDFDRSERQQILIKAIKNKALQLEILTNPSKIKSLYDTILSHLDSDLTLGNIVDLGIKFQDIPSDHIHVYNLNNECYWSICSAWAYLYTPSREYFGGASAVIPENATAQKLSVYDDIKRFVSFIFTFPDIRNDRYPINIITTKTNEKQAKRLLLEFQKMWLQMEPNNAILFTGWLDTSHINIYWNMDADIGFSPENLIVKALKSIEETIPYISVSHNEFITDKWPRIEIVLGKDASSYFSFAKTPFYLPLIESTGSNSTTGNTLSSEGKVNKINTSTKTQTKTIPSTTPYTVAPGEWENF